MFKAIAIQVRDDGSWVLTGRESDGAPSVPLAHGTFVREAGALRLGNLKAAPRLEAEEACGTVDAAGLGQACTAARFLALMLDALSGVNAPRSEWDRRSGGACAAVYQNVRERVTRTCVLPRGHAGDHEGPR